MTRLIEKLHLDRYVNARLILCLDVLLSVGASVTALFLMNTFVSAAFDAAVTSCWMAASALFSLFFFCLLQTHRSIIRHSTLKEVWKILSAVFAKVREYDYAEAYRATDELALLARSVNIPDMVRLMKRTVPEFKSKNSRFEAYDRELEAQETQKTQASQAS